MLYSSDEEEEAKRVVKTAKEKHYEELNSIIRQLKNYKKNKDIAKLLSSFESLIAAFQKAKPVIEREENNQIPKFYLKCIVELENFIHETWEDREGRKNMNKPNSKSLAALKQKFKKYSKDFEEEMTEYRANPMDDEKEEESGEDSDAESDSDDDKSDVDMKASSFLKKEEDAPKVPSKIVEGI